MNIFEDKKLLLYTVYFLVGLVCFYNVFQKNSFDTASPRLFEIFAMGTESFIINRIALTEQFGKEAYSGFLGRIPDMDNTPASRIKVPRGRSNLDEYYNYFKTFMGQYKFKPYMSNLGMQGRLLASLKLSGIINPGQDFSNYRALFSIISAFIFALLTLFLINEFGFLVALLTILYICQLDWIVASASHMFWFSGLMFTPFLVNLFLLGKFKTGMNRYFLVALFSMLTLSLLKCLTSGYEVISSFLVLNTIPVFYYWFKDRWNIKRFIIVFFGISLFSLAGVFSAMAVQAQQIDKLKADKGAGKEHLMSSYFRRSTGKGIRPNMPDRVKQSYNVTAMDVIKKYWDSELVTVNTDYHNPKVLLRASDLVYLLALATVFYCVLLFYFKTWSLSLAVDGLLIASWVSLISPMSMFVLFKSLSWLHPHLVPVTWNMPFSILVALLYFFIFMELSKKVLYSVKSHYV